MVETNITRRRVMQGVGAAGVATMAGVPIVAGQEGENGDVGDDATAIRVAHASPDAPSVQVYVDEGGAASAGDAGGNTTGGNETGDGGVGGDDGEEGDDGEPLFDGIGYSDVSDYEEVEPGTHQVSVVATEDVGLLGGLFEEGEERVVFEQEVELSAGTTYTAVAYGELSRANLEGTTPGADQDALGQDDNETAGVGAGDNETVGDDTAGTNETDAGTTDDGAAADGDESAAGEDATGTDGQGGQGGVLVDELAFGEHEYVELPADDHSIAFLETESTDAGVTGAGEDDGVGGGDNETVGGEAGNETAGQESDGNETVGSGTNETAGGASDDEAGVGDERDEKAFQVALLEDELSVTGTAGVGEDSVGGEDGGDAGGNETTGDDGGLGGGDNATGDGGAGDDDGQSRIRIFHAVPDVDTLQVVTLGDGEGAGAGDAGAGNDTGDSGVDGGGDGTGAGDDAAGADDGGAAGDGAAGSDGGTGADGVRGDEDSVQINQVSTDDGTVYSGFAVGYFDPETAGQGGGGAGADGGNVTGGGGDNATAGGDDGNATGGDDGEGDDITEDPEGREFQFVTVEDAQDGERADGGSGGGLFSLSTSVPSASD